MRRLGVAVAVLAGSLCVGLVGCTDDVTSPGLLASCSATPSSGPAPLVVRFLLTVSGAEGAYSVSVTYGDGVSGTDPDLPHTYTANGTYTAGFTVATATQSARCSAIVVVGLGPTPTPTPQANQPPVPLFKTSPPARNDTVKGTAPLTVNLNMCLTSDAEGDGLFFSIDYEGDGRFDNRGAYGGNCRKDHVYAAGTYKPELCVHDFDRITGKQLHEDQCHTFTVTATP